MSKSAPTLSNLLKNAMRGTPWRSAWRHTVSDWGSTPWLASNTATAPSSTRRERSTSMVKSTCPGVSMMLSRCAWRAKGPRMGAQEAVVAAEVMVMPRCFSWSIQSISLERKCTSPMLWMRPVKKRMRSVSVVLPASMWAMMPMLR